MVPKYIKVANLKIRRRDEFRHATTSEVDSLSLCAGESLEMAPGGYHLMLMGPLANIGEGLVVELEIHAADGRVFRYGVPVEKR